MSSKLKAIKTGVIGVGSMGQNHARVFSEISNLIAVSDLNEVQGQTVASRFGVTYFKNYDDLLREVDAVSIAVPTQYHKMVSKKCAELGVSVLIEKPLAGNLKDAEEIVSHSIQFKNKLAVGHIERHNPVISYAKKAIDKGEWGEVISMSSKRVSKFPERIRDVGVIFDLAIHDLDILRYLANSDFKTVKAIGGSIEYPDKEDHVSALVHFENGISAICEASWLSPLKVRKLSLTCSKAYVELDYMEQSVKIFSSSINSDDNSNLWKLETEITEKTINLEREEPLKLELIDFLHTHLGDRNPLVDGESGIKAVEMAEIVAGQIK